MIKRYYFYAYYKYYKLWSSIDNILLSPTFRADVSILCVTFWLLMSFETYGCILLGVETFITKAGIAVIGIILVALHLFVTRQNNWKPYFEEFENWSHKKNRVGGLIVWFFTFFIFINLFISVELYRDMMKTIR